MVTGGGIDRRRDPAWDAKRKNERKGGKGDGGTLMDERTLHPSRWFSDVK